MLDWIKSILDNYTNGMYFPNIHIKDVIEILIVAVIVYEIMLWIKNTKAWMLLRGIIMLGVFSSFGMDFSDAYDFVFGGAVDQRTGYCGCSGVSAGTASCA